MFVSFPIVGVRLFYYPVSGDRGNSIPQIHHWVQRDWREIHYNLCHNCKGQSKYISTNPFEYLYESTLHTYVSTLWSLLIFFLFWFCIPFPKHHWLIIKQDHRGGLNNNDCYSKTLQVKTCPREHTINFGILIYKPC